MKIKIKEMVCNDHPRYQGKREPNGSCLACCVLYSLLRFKKAWFTDDSSIIVRK